jgi:hypothetical protein
MRQHRRFVLTGSILFCSLSLANGGQHRPRVIWLAAIPLAISLLLAFTPIASPAFAATNSHTGSKLTATQPLSSLRLTQVSQPSVTSTVLTSRNSAGNPCKTFTSYLSFGYLGVHNEMWLKLVTYFCYNYRIVTYHKTTLYWGVTQAGAGSGWGWQISPYYSFNCFPAPNKGFWCSGNHEHATQLFINPFLRNEASLTIDQAEYYNGGTYNHFNAHICPGGC